MECNKDEAILAKDLAENRMRGNDFEGARKIALKAQNLYPELENISQMLSICDVHCSAQQRIMGSEKDWYGILQVQRLADDPTIKKQYRRLALILHPDKNRFPGAEAAFKLICEANAVLSDSAKKSLYDRKVQNSASAVVNKENYQAKRTPPFNRQFSAQNNAGNGSNNPSQNQAKGSSSYVKEDVFWTSCPFCQIRYQYHRQFLNRNLRCPTCLKPYMAYEVSARGVTPGSKMEEQGSFVPSRPESNKPTNFHVKVESSQGGSKIGEPGLSFVPSRPESSKPSDIKVKGEPNHGNFRRGVQDDKESAATHAEQQGISNKNPGGESLHGGKGNGKANNNEAGDLKSKSKKRGRKMIVESSDSELEDRTTSTSTNPATELNSGATRRSSRGKHNISYSERDDVDYPSKRSKTSKSPDDIVKDVLNDLVNGFSADATNSRSESGERVTVPPQHKDEKFDQGGKTKEETSFTSGPDLDRNNSNKDTCECPEAEFNDFDKGRDGALFKLDQYWALYDPSDSMPRFYAKVKKVISSPFEVRITWLEAVPINKSFENWVENGLPVSCGTFKFGHNDIIYQPDIFSHEVKTVCKISRKSVIYPRKGEIWALLRDWDMNWGLEPEKHKQFKYEIVEVLSDFDQGTGIRVSYLDKVDGFVSLFQKTGESEADSFLVEPDKIYRFSHCIPFFIMNGSERKGVPKGSFELDPASIPLNPGDLYCPVKAKKKNQEVEAGIYSSPSKSATKKGKSVAFEDVSSLRKGFVATHAEQQGISNKNPGGESLHGGKGNGKANNSEAVDLKSKSKKRGRKMIVESSDSELEDRTTSTSTNPATELDSGATRRSSRGKHNISYSERDDVDYPSKRSKTSKSPDDIVKDVLNDLMNGFSDDATNSRSESGERVTVPPQHKDEKFDQGGKTKEETSFTSGPDLDRNNSNKDTCECPEAEFNDFDKGRDGALFKLDQYWALYDPSDSMPRFYAKVKKVISSPFEVRITWLEAVPINKSFENWVENGLPVSCGTFKFGHNDIIYQPDIFSHEVKTVCKISRKSVIYPRKGEIWALLRDWDMNWGLEPEKHKQFKYEIVEVLSDFDQGTGIRVSYLDKVDGFVSLFQKTGDSEADSFLVEPDKIYRFSHCIPFFIMNGSERKGVPKGSFELDPASIPLNPGDLYCPVKAKKKN